MGKSDKRETREANAGKRGYHAKNGRRRQHSDVRLSADGATVRTVRRIAACSGILAAVLGLFACGGGTREAVVVQVGTTSITKGALNHWMAVMASGQPRVLAFLISSDWLIQEAANRHLKLSDQEVARRVEENKTSTEAELRGLGNETRPTMAELEFEARAELVSAKIRQMLIENERPVTPPQIADYYRKHKPVFLLPERRYFEIDELRSEAAAMKVKREVESGRSFAKLALSEERSSAESVGVGREGIDRAIFSAKPNVLTGPVLLSDVGVHSLFEVTRIVPASYQPLTAVTSSIAEQLITARRLRTRAEFTKAWTARWIAKTDCHPGYVVQKCRQYTGTRAPEDPFGLD